MNTIFIILAVLLMLASYGGMQLNYPVRDKPAGLQFHSFLF